MIKLFRNTHQNLFNEGKTFKYAIGEIVLLVSGILKSCPVRNNIWVETYENEPIQRAFRYAISCT
ncbi:MAG TPA: hypothetical protein VGA80_03380 [Flavobacteriaceae bacterium]|jgi:hypothetical protein